MTFPEVNGDKRLAELGEKVVRVTCSILVVCEDEQAVVTVLLEKLFDIFAGFNIFGRAVSELLGQVDDDSSAVVVLDNVLNVDVPLVESGL